MILYVVGIEGTDRVEIDSIWTDKGAAEARAAELKRDPEPLPSRQKPNWAVAEIVSDTPDVSLDFTTAEGEGE